MEENLLSIGNKKYYIDIDEVSESVKIDPKVISGYIKEAFEADEEFDGDFNPSTLINVPKYEMIKTMMEVVFSLGFQMEHESEMDETEKIIHGIVDGDNLESLPISFKIAFNTLIKNKLIKNYEPTVRENRTINPKVKK